MLPWYQLIKSAANGIIDAISCHSELTLVHIRSPKPIAMLLLSLDLTNGCADSAVGLGVICGRVLAKIIVKGISDHCVTNCDERWFAVRLHHELSKAQLVYHQNIESDTNTRNKTMQELLHKKATMCAQPLNCYKCAPENKQQSNTPKNHTSYRVMRNKNNFS